MQFSIRLLLFIAAGASVVLALFSAAARLRGEPARDSHLIATVIELLAVVALLVITFIVLRKTLPPIFDHGGWSQCAIWCTVVFIFAGSFVFKHYYQYLQFQIPFVTVLALHPGVPLLFGAIAITLARSAFEGRDRAFNRGAALVYLTLAVAYLCALALPLIAMLQNW